MVKGRLSGPALELNAAVRHSSKRAPEICTNSLPLSAGISSNRKSLPALPA